ncbi:MAG: hypothetical protein ACI9LV_000048 [Candidatus Nanohaloarchaea archaeon]|jgi:hypothetical protein
MDKTVEIVVVAMVALVTGVAILYLATGQAEGFDGFADGQQQSAECSYYEERISRACKGEEVNSLKEEAPEECEIQATGRECPDEGSGQSDTSGSGAGSDSDSGRTGPQE